MAASATERFDSREIVKGKSATIKYNIFGTDSYHTAIQTMETAHADSSYPGLNLGVSGLNIANIQSDSEVRPIFVDTSNVDKCIWEGEIRYYLSSNRSFNSDTAAANWSFDIGTSTQKITQSKSSYVFPSTAPDFNGAINFDGQKINGTDIIVPEFRFSIKVVLSSFSLVDAAALGEFVGKTNNAAFQGFDAECVLCLPPTGQQDTKTGNWLINHNFAYKPKTPSGTSIGDITTTSDIPGWYHIWIYYEEDTTDEMLSKKPLYVYGDKVYETANFATIQGLS